MAFEPPKAKNDMKESRRVEVASSAPSSSCEPRNLSWMLKRRKRGMLVVLDCVTARRV
jgi:hypothetical protein